MATSKIQLFAAIRVAGFERNLFGGQPVVYCCRDKQPNLY